MYFSDFAPCLLNKETPHCGHIYDTTLQGERDVTHFWKQQEQFTLRYGHFFHRHKLWQKFAHYQPSYSEWGYLMVENKPRFRAYWTLKQSTRPCSRKISVQGEIWNALSLRNVVSKAISLWAAGPFPKCERILAPCRLGKDVKVQRGTSTHGMGMAVVSLLVADKAPYGSFDTFSPQWSPSSLSFLFFSPKKTGKTLPQHLITERIAQYRIL